jgi:hypothetical protein
MARIRGRPEKGRLLSMGEWPRIKALKFGELATDRAVRAIMAIRIKSGHPASVANYNKILRDLVTAIKTGDGEFLSEIAMALKVERNNRPLALIDNMVYLRTHGSRKNTWLPKTKTELRRMLKRQGFVVSHHQLNRYLEDLGHKWEGRRGRPRKLVR